MVAVVFAQFLFLNFAGGAFWNVVDDFEPFGQFPFADFTFAKFD